jgi:hypothetical protein
MAHFAELDENSIVKQVIVVNNNELLDENGNESEAKGIAFCQSLFGGNWIQTSYNGNSRGQYAGVQMFYNKEKDFFITQTEPEDMYFLMGASEFFNRNMEEFIGKPNLKFLEIGSYVGTSAIEQIKNVLTGENSTIVCIDSWKNSFNLEAWFEKKTLPYADKITKVKSDSKTWLENNQDQVFDFIYIDGDHSTEGIESDTRLSWPLLKVGGVMALDDVLLNDETKQANNAFIESVKDKSTIIENGYQIWLRKTTK